MRTLFTAFLTVMFCACLSSCGSAYQCPTYSSNKNKAEQPLAPFVDPQLI